MVVAGGSLHLMYVSPASYMHIDIATVQALELINPLRATGAGQRSKRSGSLFGWLNHTATRCGAQLLKAGLHFLVHQSAGQQATPCQDPAPHNLAAQYTPIIVTLVR